MRDSGKIHCQANQDLCLSICDCKINVLRNGESSKKSPYDFLF